MKFFELTVALGERTIARECSAPTELSLVLYTQAWWFRRKTIICKSHLASS